MRAWVVELGRQSLLYKQGVGSSVGWDRSKGYQFSSQWRVMLPDIMIKHSLEKHSTRNLNP